MFSSLAFASEWDKSKWQRRKNSNNENSDELYILMRSCSDPNDKPDDFIPRRFEHHNRKLPISEPIDVPFNIEVKIADLGNACFDVII